MITLDSTYQIDKSTKEQRENLDNRLGDFNLQQVPKTQEEGVIDLSYTICKDGQVIAGINAGMYFWRILYIDILFVEEDYRHQKLGSFLLSKVEREAITMGAKLAHLSTYNFQAMDFYRKHGYEIFGELEYWPGGPIRYYMKKVLSS